MAAARSATLTEVISARGIKAGEDALTRLIGLLAAARASRCSSKNAVEKDVTRSTAPGVLDWIEGRVGEGLAAAGLRWDELRADLGPRHPLKPLQVDDVTLHEDSCRRLPSPARRPIASGR